MANSSDTPKKIVLSGYPVRKEDPAGEVNILPGMLVEKDVNGEIVAHATLGGVAGPYFADMQDFLGKSITDAYADGDLVQYNAHRSGDVVYALLAPGEDVNEGDNLMSHGDGALMAYDALLAAGERSIVCKAAEDKDNSAGTTNVRIKVEVM